LHLDVQQRIRLDRARELAESSRRLQHHVDHVVAAALDGGENRVRIGVYETAPGGASEIEIAHDEPIDALYQVLVSHAEMLVLVRAVVARDELVQSGAKHAPRG